MYRQLVAGAAVVAAVGTATVFADEASRLAEAAKIIQEIRADIPQEYWTKAHCVVVIPNVKKAAFIFGGEYGKGAMSCRAGERWSAPLFMQLAKGSWGFQVGAEEVDLVLLVMNESGVDKLLKNKVTLGADASVAAGPLGRRGAVGTDAMLTAEILSYSRSKGLFAGIDLSGGVLRPDEDGNAGVYGRNATPRTILASREISAPTSAAAFLRALGSTENASSDRRNPAPDQSARTSADTRGATRAASDEDARAQLIEAQQTLDRILADTTPSATGTSGTTTPASTDRDSRGTVVVDRAKLMQLRQQIEAAIAALKR